MLSGSGSRTLSDENAEKNDGQCYSRHDRQAIASHAILDVCLAFNIDLVEVSV